MKNKKLIIICPSMWPDMNLWGETQRMYYLANYLAEWGWQITVISPSYDVDKKNLEIRQKKYKNLYLGSPIKKAGGGGASGPLPRNGKWKSVKRHISNILNKCSEWFYGEPDFIEVNKKNMWIRKNRNEICRYIDKEGVQKVIISMPGFTFMQLGKRIKKACEHVRLFYDYRDPWYLWMHKKNPAYYRERYYLGFADKVVGFSEKFRIDMIKEMGIAPHKIYTVYNGYSEQAWEEFEKRKIPVQDKGPVSEKLILTYTGSMSLKNKKNNYRNPANLIEAVRELPDVELYLVGISKIQKEIVEGNIHYIGEVTQQKSFWHMQQSDVLISIHDTEDRSGEYLISGKFYDYMRSGRTILHIGKENSLMAEFVNKYHLGDVCQNHTDSLRKKILELANRKKEGKLIRESSFEQDISRYARDYQNDIYRQIIDE